MSQKIQPPSAQMSAIKIRISAVSRLLIFRFKLYQHLFWQLVKCNLIHFLAIDPGPIYSDYCNWLFRFVFSRKQ